MAAEAKKKDTDREGKEVGNKENPKAKDRTEVAKGFSELAIDNYLTGIKLYQSLWEENLKVFRIRVDYLFQLQQGSIKAGWELLGKVPFLTPLSGNPKSILHGHVDSLIDFHKESVQIARDTSDNYTQESFRLAKKNLEQAGSLFDNFLDLFKA